MPPPPPQKPIQQWEIWRVRWLHDDGTEKPRPALVISSTAYNNSHEQVWAVKISKQNYEAKYMVEMAVDDHSFEISGLEVTSYFYPTVRKKVDKAKFIVKLGYVDRFVGQLIDGMIRQSSGWSETDPA